METLSLCMITKNNEKTLARALESVLPLNPEMIIVDTGSSDATLSIAKSFHAHTYSVPWENDFSKARNAALTYATQDWILVLDSDEYLSTVAQTKIKDLLQTPTHKAYSFVVKNLGCDTSPAYPVTRMWVNDPVIRYEHRVHELIDWQFLSKYSSSDIGYLEETILHDGYATPSLLSTKRQRNLSLLEGYTSYEKDSYYYYLWGREAFFSQDYEGCLQAFNQALLHPELVQGQVTYMFLLRMYCLYYLGNYHLAISYIKHALTLTPHFRELYLILHDSYQAIGEDQLAHDLLATLNSIPIDDIHYPRILS